MRRFALHQHTNHRRSLPIALLGVLLLGHIVGSYELDIILASGDLIKNHPLYTVALVLILLGAIGCLVTVALRVAGPVVRRRR